MGRRKYIEPREIRYGDGIEWWKDQIDLLKHKIKGFKSTGDKNIDSFIIRGFELDLEDAKNNLKILEKRKTEKRGRYSTLQLNGEINDMEGHYNI